MDFSVGRSFSWCFTFSSVLLDCKNEHYKVVF